MALMTCPDCRREVSPRAAACPHCGAPIRGKKAEATTGGAALALLAGAIAAPLLGGAVYVPTGNVTLAVAAGAAPLVAGLAFASRYRR